MERLKRSIAYGLALFAFVLSLNIQANATAEDEAMVRATFLKWAADFNDKNTQQVCDLFSPDLRWTTVYPSYDYKGVPERNYADICNILRHTLNNKTKRYHYLPEIKEIIVSDNLAVVRVVWTLTVTSIKSGKTHVMKEVSLDILQKQPGEKKWRMTRFVAYEVPSPPLSIIRKQK